MICSICKGSIESSESTICCNACNTLFHSDCWNENGGCGITGCPNLPALKSKSGSSTKICPACAEEIKMDEIVCPLCNERFDTITPIQQNEFRDKKKFRPGRETPAEHKGAVILLIAGILGFTAPFNLLIGGVWYFNKRKVLLESSPVHNILAIIGLSVSVMYTIMFMIYLSGN